MSLSIRTSALKPSILKLSWKAEKPIVKNVINHPIIKVNKRGKKCFSRYLNIYIPLSSTYRRLLSLIDINYCLLKYTNDIFDEQRPCNTLLVNEDYHERLIIR